MGAFLSILSSLLGGVAKVGGAIGQGIGTVAGGIGQGVGNVAQGIGGGVGKVGSTIGSGIEGLIKNLTTGGEPMGGGGGFWEGSGGNAGSDGTPQGGIKGLLQNKLLAQLLASEGADLMGNTPGKNLGSAIQGNIASQNYAKMLSQILAGGTPPPGVKHTIDGGAESGMHKRTITMDHSILDPSIGGVPQAKAPPIQPTDWLQAGMGLSNPFPTSQPATTAPAPAGAEAQVPTATSDPMMQLLTQLLGGGQSNLGAGFANLRPSDLAGVSPEMMSSALQFKMQQEQLGKKNIMDVVGIMTDIQRNKALENYYNQLGEQGKSSAEIARTREERLAKGDTLDQEFPVQVPGVGKVTTRQWNALPKDTQDYAMYVNSVLPGEKVLNPQEFKNLDPTVQEKFLRRAMEDPELMKAAKELRESGAIRITTGEKAEAAAAIKRATSAEEAWAQLHNPTQLNALVKKAVDDPVTANAIFAARDNPAEMTRIKGRTVAGVIDNMVRAGGGRFVKDTVLSKDGKTLTYTIKWPNHPEPEVFTYAIE
jgi:hypothetical protein